MRPVPLLIVIASCIFIMVCGVRENYLELQSIDRDQTFRRDAEEVQVFPNTVLDATLLQDMIQEQSYYSRTFPTILQSVSDSSSFVLRLDRKLKGTEGEIFISLFGEFCGGQITRLYLLEVGQGELYWQLVESAFIIGSDTAHERVNLSAVMRSVDFETSFTIQFPYVYKDKERGLLDYDIDKYMIVKCEFGLDEDLLGFFP